MFCSWHSSFSIVYTLVILVYFDGLNSIFTSLVAVSRFWVSPSYLQYSFYMGAAGLFFSQLSTAVDFSISFLLYCCISNSFSNVCTSAILVYFDSLSSALTNLVAFSCFWVSLSHIQYSYYWGQLDCTFGQLSTAVDFSTCFLLYCWVGYWFRFVFLQ